MKYKVCLILTMALFIQACQAFSVGEKRKCDEVFESSFNYFPTEETNIEVLRDWIKKYYSKSPNGFEISDGTYGFSWVNQTGIQVDKTYRILILKDYSEFSVEFKQNIPTVSDVTRCFGNPVKYSARYHSDLDLKGALYVGLQFSGSQAIAEMHRWGKHQPLIESDLISFVTVTSSQSPDYKRLKPWPGDLKNIVIETKE